QKRRSLALPLAALWVSSKGLLISPRTKKKMLQGDMHTIAESLRWPACVQSKLPPPPSLPDMPPLYRLPTNFYRAELFEMYEQLWLFIHNESKQLFSPAIHAAYTQWLLDTLPIAPEQAPQ